MSRLSCGTGLAGLHPAWVSEAHGAWRCCCKHTAALVKTSAGQCRPACNAYADGMMCSSVGLHRQAVQRTWALTCTSTSMREQMIAAAQILLRKFSCTVDYSLAGCEPRSFAVMLFALCACPCLPWPHLRCATPPAEWIVTYAGESTEAVRLAV